MTQEEVDSWLRCIQVEYECGDLTREEYLKEKKWYESLLDKEEDQEVKENGSPIN